MSVAETLKNTLLRASTFMRAVVVSGASVGKVTILAPLFGALLTSTTGCASSPFMSSEILTDWQSMGLALVFATDQLTVCVEPRRHTAPAPG